MEGKFPFLWVASYSSDSSLLGESLLDSRYLICGLMCHRNAIQKVLT